jgi:hypothetical protein
MQASDLKFMQISAKLACTIRLPQAAYPDRDPSDARERLRIRQASREAPEQHHGVR